MFSNNRSQPLIVALGFALLASVWKLGVFRHVIHVRNAVFTILPGDLPCPLILNIPDVYWFGSHREKGFVSWDWGHVATYLCILALTEVGRSAFRFQSLLDEQGQKSYMEAADIVGCTPFQKLKRHFFRPLIVVIAEEILVLFSRLLLLSALGFFYHPLNQ